MGIYRFRFNRPWNFGFNKSIFRSIKQGHYSSNKTLFDGLKKGAVKTKIAWPIETESVYIPEEIRMTFADKERKKQIAEESPKTQKARQKLKRQFDAIDKKITPHALEKKTIEIQRWISRHASHRIPLKSKCISLFDENQNTADLSVRISQLADQIKTEFQTVSEDGEAPKMAKRIFTN